MMNQTKQQLRQNNNNHFHRSVFCTTIRYLIQRFVVVAVTIFVTTTLSPNAFVVWGKKEHHTVGECLPSSTDYTLFHCFPRNIVQNVMKQQMNVVDVPTSNTQDESSSSSLLVECVDIEERCSEWSTQGECQNNPNYMLINCRKSCQSCVDGHCGVPQILPPDDHQQSNTNKILVRLIQTAQYVQEVTTDHIRKFQTCYNSDPLCTYWAVIGECEKNPQFMKTKCAATCQVCA